MMCHTLGLHVLSKAGSATPRGCLWGYHWACRCDAWQRVPQGGGEPDISFPLLLSKPHIFLRFFECTGFSTSSEDPVSPSTCPCRTSRRPSWTPWVCRSSCNHSISEVCHEAEGYGNYCGGRKPRVVVLEPAFWTFFFLSLMVNI